jgi:pimeloyl-ACP methyl ester carboxylesterase
VPARWNGRLLLYMHGFEELGPEAQATAPDMRRYLIGRGYAWGASSFSSTSLIPGRAADETAALWDYFARTYGRPRRTYVNGLSMGGMATHIAAERYGNRFDGALAMCGSAGQTQAVSAEADFFAAGAFAAGVTQAELDASGDVGRLIRERILPALRDPQVHERFEQIMVDLTGGPRLFDREGFHLEEETNWRRAGLLVAAGLAPNRDTSYWLGPASGVTSEVFNRAVVRLRTNDELLAGFVAGNETTGRLQLPLLTLHTTGDGQVPIEQARILRRRVDAAGKRRLLVQRVIHDPSHCGFTTTEMEAGLRALVAWVERGVKPKGHDVLVGDLRTLRRTFELSPRPGTPEADRVRGARDRVVVRGSLRLDGAPFDARWLGAVVRRGGLTTPCQYTLAPVTNGRYEITVLADAESTGCGAPGAEILLWTFARDRKLYTGAAVRWPGNGRATSFDSSFSTAAPHGAAPLTSDFSGEVFRRGGRHVPPGTRIEAYVGDTRCGVASVRRTGNFAGYILAVAGPDSVAGCAAGATLTFRINGRPALETAVNEPGRGMPLDLTR